MKKIKMYMLVIIILTITTTTGSPVDASSSTKDLKKQISQLKKENALLKKKNKEYKDWETGLKSSEGLMRTIKVLEYKEDKVQFFKDTQKLFPTLSNGSSFRTYLIDDQLYAPIEAVGKSLYGTSKKVTWDKTRKGIYFGEKPTGTTISMINFPSNRDSRIDITTNEYRKFDLYTRTVNPRFSLKGYNMGSIFYDLNKNYKSLKGYYAVPYSYLGEKKQSEIGFYSVNSYGDAKYLTSYELKAGDNEISVDVDVSGVEHLMIRFFGDDSVLYDYSLTGLKF